MGVAQKWLALTAGLGALALVVTHPSGFAKLATGVQTIVGGTTSTIVNSGGTGGR